MLKNFFILCTLLALFCGCSTAVIYNQDADDGLTQKNKDNASEMAQIFGNKQDAVILLDFSELQTAMKDVEKFADEVKMLGFTAVGVPVDSVKYADLHTDEGKKLYEFVMSLNAKSLRVVYALHETALVNRRRGNEFVFGNKNPYSAILLKLKEFWRELPDSAEMPTVVIELGMNRWNDTNLDRPASLVHVWRKENYGAGKSNDVMFAKSMKNFADSRSFLDLEQLILLADEEVVTAGENRLLSGGKADDILKKSDALSINLASEASDYAVKLNFLSKLKEQHCVFFAVSASGCSRFADFLNKLSRLNDFARKNQCSAGIFVRDWKKLNSIWRNEK